MGMQLKLHMVTIEDLVPEEHFLRKLEATLDLSFVREETAYLYRYPTSRYFTSITGSMGGRPQGRSPAGWVASRHQR